MLLRIENNEMSLSQGSPGRHKSLVVGVCNQFVSERSIKYKTEDEHFA